MTIQRKLTDPYPNAKYSFDTNVYIAIWRYHYPPDVFPTIYEALEELIKNGVIKSAYAVKVELEKQKDEIFEYFEKFPDLFVEPTPKEQKYVKDLVNQEDLSGWSIKDIDKHYADPYVVALAKAYDLRVVTYESGTSSNTIGRACEILEVEICSFSNLLRLERISF